MTQTNTNVEVTQPYTPPYYNDLTAALTHAWACLARGSADRRSPFHAPVVASVDANNAPNQRTMILRKIDVATRTLRFFTDMRSTKILDWQTNPQVSVLAYSVSDKIQLRLSGVVKIELESDLANNCWANLRDTARAGYAQADTPGAAINAPDCATSTLSSTARNNFCLIHVAVDSLDWVYLNNEGNRRAQFSWLDGVLHAQWLAP